MNDKGAQFGAIAAAVIITIIITISAVFMWQNQNPTIDETADWLTYTSEEGFSFKYPEGFTVSENVDPEDSEVTNIFVVEAENRPPVLQINVSKNSITFSLWEGAAWSGFPKIVETFETL